jgi:hypothetical protein
MLPLLGPQIPLAAVVWFCGINRLLGGFEGVIRTPIPYPWRRREARDEAYRRYRTPTADFIVIGPIDDEHGVNDLLPSLC